MTDRPFFMTPQEHRDRAEYLRLRGTPEALEQAYAHEVAAKLIEKRLEQQGAAFPIAPV